jgi:TetR/AcrR family transcriptional regulator, mexJK operon transcriptional repressor
MIAQAGAAGGRLETTKTARGASPRQRQRPASGRRLEKEVERRAAMLKVAAAVFCERGYAQTTMSFIAEKIGGSKGTLWRYFPSKDELFAAFIADATEKFREAVIPGLDASVPLQESLAEFCFRFITTLRAPAITAMYRMVIGESGRAPEIGKVFCERGPDITLDLLATFLQDQIALKRLRPDDPREVASFILSLCTGLGHTRTLLGMTTATSASARKEANWIARLVLRAYGP